MKILSVLLNILQYHLDGCLNLNMRLDWYQPFWKCITGCTACKVYEQVFIWSSIFAARLIEVCVRIYSINILKSDELEVLFSLFVYKCILMF